ncbi:hypothetical protein RQP53_01170 [Paucibacter sp. APW11]|uniref:Uncharacterized protein n=1 Tax=Roseateles aquae TaxID=3077235 RepID=A0ABU3P5N4_9BURK|nr:hypothetical protein [Paucibacter sp. APW11]MDT8997880.1 hypothetical protein [Paucibacter sp. APW11]
MFAFKNFIAPVATLAPLRSSFVATTLVAGTDIQTTPAEDVFATSRLEEVGLMAVNGLFGLTLLIALIGG